MKPTFIKLNIVNIINDLGTLTRAPDTLTRINPAYIVEYKAVCTTYNSTLRVEGTEVTYLGHGVGQKTITVSESITEFLKLLDLL